MGILIPIAFGLYFLLSENKAQAAAIAAIGTLTWTGYLVAVFDVIFGLLASIFTIPYFVTIPIFISLGLVSLYIVYKIWDSVV